MLPKKNKSLPNYQPTLASFFTGIGGFDLGFHHAGFDVVAQCEIDPFCNTVLDKYKEEYWPNVRKFLDIKEVKGATIPAADVWTGGFPCQDVSLARMGPRAGLKGKRSGLFYDFARLIGECLPSVVILENVQGLLTSHNGRDFEVVVRTLAEIGYAVGWRVLNSRYFGVPQSRQRVYIVGCYRDGRGVGEILFESERGQGHLKTSGQDAKNIVSPFKSVFGDLGKGPIVQGLAYCLYACSARHTGTDWSRTYVSYPDGRVRRLTPRECEGIQGFPYDWTLPDHNDIEIDRLYTLRYTALGNAVSVPTVTWIAERTHPVIQRMKTEAEHVRLVS